MFAWLSHWLFTALSSFRAKWHCTLVLWHGVEESHNSRNRCIRFSVYIKGDLSTRTSCSLEMTGERRKCFAVSLRTMVIKPDSPWARSTHFINVSKLKPNKKGVRHGLNWGNMLWGVWQPCNWQKFKPHYWSVRRRLESDRLMLAFSECDQSCRRGMFLA